ncbi:hypothetical protein MBLNU230_g1681t1 [Neophaeotheca triangularis]
MQSHFPILDPSFSFSSSSLSPFTSPSTKQKRKLNRTATRVRKPPTPSRPPSAQQWPGKPCRRNTILISALALGTVYYSKNFADSAQRDQPPKQGDFNVKAGVRSGGGV